MTKPRRIVPWQRIRRPRRFNPAGVQKADVPSITGTRQLMVKSRSLITDHYKLNRQGIESAGLGYSPVSGCHSVDEPAIRQLGRSIKIEG